VLLLALLVGCQTPTASAPTGAPEAPPSPSAQIAADPPAPAQGAGRVDVLNAADTALDSGDPSTASGLYVRVLNTPAAGETAGTTSAINAYARFRDMVALLANGDEADARAELDALQQADASAPLARLGSQLWDQYGMVGSVRGACAQLQPQIASQVGPTLSALQDAGVSVDPNTLCSPPGAAMLDVDVGPLTGTNGMSE
jgi:hypothetical protein